MESIKQAVQSVIDYARRGSLEAFITAVVFILFAAAATAVFAEDGTDVGFYDRHPDTEWGKCETSDRVLGGEPVSEVTCYTAAPPCLGKQAFGDMLESTGGVIVMAAPVADEGRMVFVTTVGYDPFVTDGGARAYRSIDVYLFNEPADQMCHAASATFLSTTAT